MLFATTQAEEGNRLGFLLPTCTVDTDCMHIYVCMCVYACIYMKIYMNVYSYSLAPTLTQLLLCLVFPNDKTWVITTAGIVSLL